MAPGRRKDILRRVGIIEPHTTIIHPPNMNTLQRYTPSWWRRRRKWGLSFTTDLSAHLPSHQADSCRPRGLSTSSHKPSPLAHLVSVRSGDLMWLLQLWVVSHHRAASRFPQIQALGSLWQPAGSSRRGIPWPSGSQLALRNPGSWLGPAGPQEAEWKLSIV